MRERSYPGAGSPYLEFFGVGIPLDISFGKVPSISLPPLGSPSVGNKPA